jgi:biopolymer transport protein ExbD
MRRDLTANDREDVEINLSPMIDMVFILLIFFIAITKDNKVIYGGRDIGIAGVAPQVKRLVLKEDIPVIIQADEGANHGVFARVYGEAKLAGAKSINFSTKR